MLHIAIHLLALSLLGLGVWLPGYAAERWLFRQPFEQRADPATRLATRWCAGLAYWICGLFAMAAFGFYRPLPMVFWAAMGAGLALLTYIRGRSTARALDHVDGGPAQEESLPPPFWIHSAPALALFLVLGSAFLIAINPTVSWDASAYHLSLPQLFLEAGGFRPVPMNVYNSWPLATELLFGVALALGGPMLAKAAHFGFGLLVLTLLWRIVEVAADSSPATGLRSTWTRSTWTRSTWMRSAWIGPAWLALALFLANGVVVFELKVAYVDLAHAFYLLAGLLFVWRAYSPGDPTPAGEPPSDPGHGIEARLRLCALAGLAAGLLAGVKVSGFVSGVILALLALPLWLRRTPGEDSGDDPGGRAARRRSFLAFTVPVLILALPWPLRNLTLTGNPVYPWLWELWGGPDWSAELGRQFAAWQRGIGMGREPMDYLLLPFRVVLSGGRGYERFDGALGSFWLAATPIALTGFFTLSGERARLHRSSLLVAALSFLFWALTAQQMRFLIPALPPLALATAISFGGWLERRAPGSTSGNAAADQHPARRAPYLAPRLALYLTLGSLAFLSIFALGNAAFLSAGASHLELYRHLEGRLDPRQARPPIFERIDTLPADSKILLLQTNQRFYSNREVLADSFFEASQISLWLNVPSVEEVGDRLRGRGITHILIDLRPRGVPYPVALLELLRTPGQVRPVHQDETFLLLELPPLGDP